MTSVERFIDSVIAYEPQASSSKRFLSRRAATFSRGGRNGIWPELSERGEDHVCYLDYTDHSICFFDDQSLDGALAKEETGRFWAYVANVRWIHCTLLAAGSAVHRFTGRKIRYIGGPMSIARWGVLTGLSLPYSHGVALGALLHTYHVGGSLWKLALKGGGIAYGSYLVGVWYPMYRARANFREGYALREGLPYNQTWLEVSQHLQQRLNGVLAGEDDPELTLHAQQLLDQADRLATVYGIDAQTYHLKVVPICNDIVQLQDFRDRLNIERFERARRDLERRGGEGQLLWDSVPRDNQQRLYHLRYYIVQETGIPLEVLMPAIPQLIADARGTVAKGTRGPSLSRVLVLGELEDADEKFDHTQEGELEEAYLLAVYFEGDPQWSILDDSGLSESLSVRKALTTGMLRRSHFVTMVNQARMRTEETRQQASRVLSAYKCWMHGG